MVVVVVNAAFLKLHVMWLVRGCESKVGRQVAFQHGSGSNLGQQDGVHRLLVGLALVRDHGCLGSVALEEFRFSLLGGILGSGKVLVREFCNVHLADIQFRRGRNHVRLVDAAERHAVDLVRARHEQEAAAAQCLEAHDALAAKAAGEDNQNRARSDGLADSWGVLPHPVHGLLRLQVLGGVVARLFLFVIVRFNNN